MTSTALDVKFSGDWKAIQKTAEKLTVKRNRAAYRAAAMAGSRVIRKKAKQGAPKDSGSLRKSMAVKAKAYSQSGVVTGIIGPGTEGSGHVYEVSINTGMGWKASKTAVPARYIHLVTYGFRNVVGGTLSRAQSKAGGKSWSLGGTGIRRTTRRSEEQKVAEGRSASKRRRHGVATIRQQRRTGAGRIMGTVPPNKFLEKAMDRAARNAVTAFTAKYGVFVKREWAKVVGSK